MTLPNFFIIGAAKSGTTSLYRYLQEHPQIYMSPVKEPGFFSTGITLTDKNHRARKSPLPIADPGEYEALFLGGRRAAAVGEASAQYLYIAGTAQRIQGWIPDPKFIAILRNPVERAFSHFNQQRNRANERNESVGGFEQALEDEDKRIRRGIATSRDCRAMGFYSTQIRRYLDLFGRERVRAFLYEDLCSSPKELLGEIFRFLGVEDVFVPDLEKVYNKGVYAVPPPDPRLRRNLAEGYREDILRLQSLIGRDLSSWLCETVNS